MADKSIYERANPSRIEQAGGMCLGTIVAVNTSRRLCSVQTFAGSGGLNDQYIPECQWLSLDSNPAGDEFTSIPRINSVCAVVFIDGEPFVIGFLKGMNGELGAASGNEYDGSQGDKIISTVGGNRLVIKRSGVIEIFSKETLKRVYMPLDSRLIDICRNYEMKSDGGFHKWLVTLPLNTTKLSSEYRRDLTRSQIIYDEIGTVDATTIFRRTMGTALPTVEGVSIPQFKHEIKTTGENIIAITPPGGVGGIQASFAPTGAIAVTTGLPGANQLNLSVGVDGTTSVEINKIAKVSIGAIGDIKAENKGGSMALSATGAVELKNKLGSFTMSEAGKFAAKGVTGELLDLFDKHLEQQTNILTAILSLSVGTGTGPSSPPINAADFTKALTAVIQLRTLLAGIKG